MSVLFSLPSFVQNNSEFYNCQMSDLVISPKTIEGDTRQAKLFAFLPKTRNKKKLFCSFSLCAKFSEKLLLTDVCCCSLGSSS